MSDIFDGIEKAEIGNQGGVSLSEGEYLLKITDVQQLKTQTRGDAFIVEYEVVESSDTDKHPVGSKRSWYQSMQKLKIAFEQITLFMWAVLGYDQKRDADRIKAEVTPNLRNWTNLACSQKILNGQLVRATVRPKPPSAKAKLEAQAAGKPEPKPFDTARFAPFSKDPPPVTAAVQAVATS